jgi:hypothetical protein
MIRAGQLPVACEHEWAFANTVDVAVCRRCGTCKSVTLRAADDTAVLAAAYRAAVES